MAKVKDQYEELPPWAVPCEPYGPNGDWRTLHKHDIDEIVYKHAFRKLAQKTQVIVQPADDNFRTRLTHTLEVAQIADNFCFRLNLNQDLTRAIAFAHDLGHPPFAHVGEHTLNRLLTQFVERTALGYGIPKDQAGDIASHFTFKHSHNSRRILQRKTNGLSTLTLQSVVGHNWSPWKECSTLDSVEEVSTRLLQPLGDGKPPENPTNFLPCYEAQAVALSDQIAALSSDVEDLIHLEHNSPDHLRQEAFTMLERLKFENSVKGKVREILDSYIAQEDDSKARQRGWGRKHRFGLTLGSIIDASRARVESCRSYQDSVNKPLAPSHIMAIALDVLERVSRRLIYANPEIRGRDTLAEAATTIMFSRFLALETEDNWYGSSGKAERFVARMREDYKNWKVDYNIETQRETSEKGVTSFPDMKKTASPIKDLWEAVAPAVATVDYISEMTDRFVIHDVFADDSLQEVLLENFDRRFTDEQ